MAHAQSVEVGPPRTATEPSAASPRRTDGRHPDLAESAEKKETKAQAETGWKGKLHAVQGRLEHYAAVRILESVIEGFQRDRLSEQAASMTYFGIFSLFPLILLFMSLAGLALQSNDDARQQILNVVVGLLPQGQDALSDMITKVIEAKVIAAGLGLLTLLWSALGWFQVFDTNINRIWGVDKPRSFIKGKLIAVAMIAGIGGVGLLSWGATAAINLLTTFTNVIPGSVAFWQLVVSLVTLLTVALVFFLLYRYTPQRHIAFADVWPAALITAVVWEVVRRTLALYLERTDMVSGYGPIGAAMALLFWIYVASTIVLLGAELTYAIAKERRHISPEEEMPVVARPGEQPTPKFAPQTGRGFTAGQDKDEPTQSIAMPKDTGASDGQPSGQPSKDAALATGAAATDADQEPQHDGESHGVSLPTPLVAAAGLGVGFVAGRIVASRHHEDKAA